MHSRFGTIGMAALVVGVLASSTGGCASERDPINRVQSNAIPKSFFVGEKLNDASDDPTFYARTMVINVPYGESAGDLLFTNTINAVAKIKWEIEEKNLVGRVSYERIQNTDGQGPTPIKDGKRDPSRPLAQNDGLVVYNFKIDSQFDIRRAYNAQTGEESNTIEENSTDRVWSDRDYIRVDFSQNLVTTAYDFDTMSLLNIIDGVKYTPMAFAVNNPADENAPVYDIKNGYLDVTNKVFAEPQTVDFDGMKFPSCFLPNFVLGGTDPVGNCNPNEITLRHSFKRVTNTDYEPTDWDGQRFETYGAFTTERNGYARDYGVADAEWKRYISRYNIWERNHYYTKPDTMEGATSCKVDAECSAIGNVAGISHCDTYNQKCSLPYQQRKAKPITWYYSDGSDPTYYEATRDATEEWDTAMRVAVQVAKFAECSRFGNVLADADCKESFPGVIDGNFADEEDAMFLVHEVNACRRQAAKDKKADPIAECSGLADQLGAARAYSAPVIAVAKLPEMITLCHSPVADDDPATCGKKGTVARLGDLRYHLISGIASPQTDSPWGIMSDSNDPETGEHVAASVNVWTSVDDLFARGLVDTFRYIGGELTTDQITDGSYVHNWIEAARLSNGIAFSPVLGGAEADKRIAAVGGVTADKLRALREKIRARSPMKASPYAASVDTRTPIEKALMADLKRVADTKASWDAPTTSQPTYDARMNLLRNTTAEAAVMTPAMQQMGQSALGDVASSTGVATGTTMSASVLQGLKPGLRQSLENTLENALAERGSCVSRYEALAPLGYTALADELQAKFGKFNAKDDAVTQSARADKMKDFLRRRAHYAVISHEMGHSFGLRHNFVSSSDSWNYRPQYWALRTNGKTVTNECPADGSASEDGRKCIGPRWLDKITDNENKNLIHTWAQSSTMEYAGEPSQDLIGIGAYDFGAARMFYGDAVEVYKDGRFNKSKPAGAAAEDHQNDFGGLLGFRYGNFQNPIHYSLLDKNFGLLEKCSTVNPQSFKPTTWDDTKDGNWSPLLDGHIVTNEDGKPTRCTQPTVDFVQWDAMKSTQDKTHAEDPAGRVRVPHAFASDNWADLGNVAVFRHDNGADLYETMHFWQAQQEMTHLFVDYRRGRRDFSIWAAFQRTLTRYHEKMRDSAKAIGLYSNIARDTVVNYNANGEDPQAYIASVLQQVAPENALASTIAFDQFAHVFARPEPGPHGTLGNEEFGTGAVVARSYTSTGFADQGLPLFNIANGVTGGYGSISLAGRPIENALSTVQGRDYNQLYTMNVGSYYEKAFAAYLFTESADNFISANRDDFVDPRFRSVSVADVFPDGFRRWLANNLTNDEQIKGVYLAGDGGGVDGAPVTDADNFAQLGTTQWWPTEGMEVCFPQNDRIICNDPFTPGTPTPAGGTVADPQVGFEQQKFALLFTLIYLPTNARTNWLDMMRIYDVSRDGDPGFQNRIEFHDPNGQVFVAQTFGTEVLFGKTVQKGIGARVLEYANSLLAKSVVTEPVMSGAIQVGLRPKLDADGKVQFVSDGAPTASCETSRFCQKMKDYTEIPQLMYDWERLLGWGRDGGGLRGVY